MFLARKSAVAFHLHSAFVAPNNIVEGVVKMVSCPSQSLALVHFAYQLAIPAASKGPAQGRPASKDRSETDRVSLIGQETVQLVSSCLVIESHLIIYNLPYLRCYFRWSSGSKFSSYRTCRLIMLQKLVDANSRTLQPLLF